MNCKNCGAPMQLFRDRQYFHCEYCNTYQFPQTADGIRQLGLSPHGERCPVCREALLLASYDDRHNIHYCSRCKGMLFERWTFGETIERQRAWTELPPDPPAPMNRAELQRRLVCPLCGSTMATHPYYGPGNIVIDTCDPCNVLWLDFGELQRAVNAPGRDRGAALLKRERERFQRSNGYDEEDGDPRRRIDLTDLLITLFD